MGPVTIKLLHRDTVIAALRVPPEELDVFEDSPNFKHGGDTRIINSWIFSPIQD